MFGAAFDGVVLRRFWAFIKPYQRALYFGILGVLAFTATQMRAVTHLDVNAAQVEEAGQIVRTLKR